WLSVFAAAIGASMTWIEAVAAAVFVARYNADAYATVAMLGAMAVPASGVGLALVQRRVPVITGWLLGLARLIVSVGGCGRLLAWTDLRWPALAAMVLAELAWAWLYIVFWGLAGSVFDERQAARWFGPLGAVETAAALGAGLTIAPGVRFVPLAGLLGMAALGVVVSMVCVLALRDDLRPSVAAPEPARLSLHRDAYAWTLFAM